ncbi:hypothetical protein K439DRAFT_1659493 [Ramaria rubella]|nr:hypothetical protein K439DRAFT_1659493 [Ramaria rubella]
MLSVLREKHQAILDLQQTYHTSVPELQATLRDEVLPDLLEELEFDEGYSEWAREWLDDYGSIFRMYKKHGFNRAETNLALERTLRWRILDSGLYPLPNEHIGPMEQSSNLFIQCLPAHIHDIFGRPVLLIRLANLSGSFHDTKQHIVCAHEEMRQRLCSRGGCEPTLQCVMIVDVKGVTLGSTTLELIPWFVREIAPRFPGMCAAVFVVNHSWAYGLYSIVKRLLPANVLSRIYFPSESDLLTCFESDRLSRDYGGDLDISDPKPPSPNLNIIAGPSSLADERPPDLPPTNINLSRFLPSMSALNPYFGYPAVSGPGSSVPYLKNGRRRKRDLARTLSFLWYAKLKKLTDKTWLWILMTLVLWTIGLRKYK